MKHDPGYNKASKNNPITIKTLTPFEIFFEEMMVNLFNNR